MTHRQLANHKSNNLFLVGGTRMLPKIILKPRHLKYRRSVKKEHMQKFLLMSQLFKYKM
jgi:hypothetical protein